MKIVKYLRNFVSGKVLTHQKRPYRDKATHIVMSPLAKIAERDFVHPQFRAVGRMPDGIHVKFSRLDSALRDLSPLYQTSSTQVGFC